MEKQSNWVTCNALPPTLLISRHALTKNTNVSSAVVKLSTLVWYCKFSLFNHLRCTLYMTVFSMSFRLLSAFSWLSRSVKLGLSVCPADSRTCSLAHCQYGCEEVQGEVRCLCPSPGLQLGSDGKTCEGENSSSDEASKRWRVLRLCSQTPALPLVTSLAVVTFYIVLFIDYV